MKEEVQSYRQSHTRRLSEYASKTSTRAYVAATAVWLTNPATRALAAGDATSIKPNASGLPGTSQAMKLVSGVMFLAVVGVTLSIIMGAARWALGNKSHNYQQSADGKQQVLASLAGAFLLGAAGALVRFFMAAGSGV